MSETIAVSQSALDQLLAREELLNQILDDQDSVRIIYQENDPDLWEQAGYGTDDEEEGGQQ
jgi:hypothetical protein